MMVGLGVNGSPTNILFLRFYCRLWIMPVALCGVTANGGGILPVTQAADPLEMELESTWG